MRSSSWRSIVAVAAGEEVDDAVDHPPVLLLVDVADARRLAALDVVVEARRAAAPPGLRALAGAEQEDLLQQVERAAHLLGVRVRAEVGALAAVALAREVHAREVLVEGDRDVRIGLVVAQPDVEARLVLLDEVLLGQQRLGLGLDDEVLDRVDELAQLDEPARGRAREVRGDALADRLGLAHVEHAPAGVAEQVHAGLVGQRAALLGEPAFGAFRSGGDGHLIEDRVGGWAPRSTSTATRRRARPRACAARWRRPRSATSSAGSTPPSTRSRSGSQQLLGHEAALYLPTGTLCNVIATRLHVRPGGDEVLLHHSAHPFNAEAGGPAAISGATLHGLDGEGGIVAPATFEAAINAPGDRYGPRTRVLWVEQTTNIGGRAGVAARDGRARAGDRRPARPARPPRRGAADERGGRERSVGGRVRVRLRHGVAGLQQGPGRAVRGLPGRVGGADRRGVALQADARRRAAPGRRGGGGRALRARPPRRAAGRGPRQRAAPRRRSGSARQASRSTRRSWSPTS